MTRTDAVRIAERAEGRAAIAYVRRARGQKDREANRATRIAIRDDDCALPADRLRAANAIEATLDRDEDADSRLPSVSVRVAPDPERVKELAEALAATLKKETRA